MSGVFITIAINLPDKAADSVTLDEIGDPIDAFLAELPGDDYVVVITPANPERITEHRHALDAQFGAEEDPE